MNWKQVIAALHQHERVFQRSIESADNAQQMIVYGTAAFIVGALAVALAEGLKK